MDVGSLAACGSASGKDGRDESARSWRAGRWDMASRRTSSARLGIVPASMRTAARNSWSCLDKLASSCIRCPLDMDAQQTRSTSQT